VVAQRQMPLQVDGQLLSETDGLGYEHR
jgi:hypothetical protein